MSSTSHQTHDHKEIKSWVTKRDGVPAKVRGTDNAKGEGVLSIAFPKNSESDDALQEIDWKDFFDEFDQRKLDFLYQDKKADGAISTFNKFVTRK